MTLMQRRFLAGGEESIRERLSVLNIRHSLSAVLLYCCARDRALPRGGFNVNGPLRDCLAPAYAYVRGAEFEALLLKKRARRRIGTLI